MIFTFLLAFQIFAVQLLDVDMSPEDIKKTGIDKLNATEKAALQEWIEANYEKKPKIQTTEKLSKARNPTLSENLMNSRYLRLSDGTLWNIRPEDVPIAQGWISAAEISVEPSKNPFFAYKLTNKLSGSSVLARKADKLPPAGSPPLAPNEPIEITLPPANN